MPKTSYFILKSCAFIHRSSDVGPQPFPQGVTLMREGQVGILIYVVLLMHYVQFLAQTFYHGGRI